MMDGGQCGVGDVVLEKLKSKIYSLYDMYCVFELLRNCNVIDEKFVVCLCLVITYMVACVEMK